jgi:hypothetical protein
MKSRASARAVPPFILLTGLLAAVPASACSICMGDANSPIAPAMNAAIFLMLGCIGSVLFGVASFALYLRHRSRAPLPPHEELGHLISGLEEGQHHA